MARLAKPLEDLRAHYGVIVVGSGYGGAIAASRLSRAGQRVCVLERGREHQPGEFPETLKEAAAQTQINGPNGQNGSPTGLYEFHVGQDMSVFKGCGLGGTSLVNANVSLRADPRVFEDPCWPEELRSDKTDLERGYGLAEQMLRPTPYPATFPRLAKMEAHKRSAEKLGERWYPTPINVTFEDGLSPAGVEQKACNLCGDCVAGCNHGAKNTVLMNYLPDAVRHGAEIFTQINVRYLERNGDSWRIHYEPLHAGIEKLSAPTFFVEADLVVLGAGALGSTEILLRSRDAGLEVSDQLGQRFTGNGDVLGFGYASAEGIHGVGFGHRDPKTQHPVGPCITSVIDMRDKDDLESGSVLEEGTMPGPLASVLGGAMFMAAQANQATEAKESGKAAVADKAPLAKHLVDKAIQRTQTYLVMSHDDGQGRLALEKDRLTIRWPKVGAQPNFFRANQDMKRAAEAIDAKFVQNPFWMEALGKTVISVHPLGGCGMADSSGSGVVNHKGQVFCESAGSNVYPNLYVSDGAVLPRPVGANPLLTISAITERCCRLIAEDRGWTIDYQSAGRELAEYEGCVELHFAERMTGFFSSQVTGDFQAAHDFGRREKSSFDLTASVTFKDLDSMLMDPDHPGTMIGTVVAPALSKAPMILTEGTVNLFIENPGELESKRMDYRGLLSSKEGDLYFFDGFKTVPRTGKLSAAWRDTSTLYITVHEGKDSSGPVVGKGIIGIRPDDFAKQMSTLEVRNAPTRSAGVEAQAKFGHFFGGVLFDHYGGVCHRTTELQREPMARKKRPLELPPGERIFFDTNDGLELLLTRFQGGSKGPVLLAPGFGMPARSFLLDTVDVNLTEFLVANGYDVFLFDYRASTDLPTSQGQFSMDEVAALDYPAAVAKVRESTGADSVQVMGHCMGSLTLLMALATGMKGVRSAVCSQATLHLKTPLLSKVKANPHLGNLFERLGIESLTTDFDPDSWKDRLFDQALKLQPSREQCTSAVCRRILFQYGEVFKHENVNRATHEALHEYFGVANLTSMLHVTKMVREGKAVSAAGEDIYLTRLDQLQLPIAFLHGEENRMFQPVGSEMTYELLREANNPELYSRHVVPGYAHLDCFIGKDSSRDVFPMILSELDAHN